MGSKPVLINRMAILGGHRISRDANQVSMSPERSQEDANVWEDKSYKYELGKWMGDISVSGHTTDEVEKRFLEELAKSSAPSLPMTIFLANGTGAAGEDAAQVDACALSLPRSGEHGRIQRFDLTGKPQDRVMFGQILESSIGTTGIIAAQDGTAVELGEITEDQKLVVVYHVLNYPAVEGTTPTLDSKVQSATDEAFTTPVDRITLPQRDATPVGSVHELAGPVTDTWWRFSVTSIGGTATPKFWVVVTAAIIAA